jgi:carboxyl-terminal processing protease
MNVTRWVLIAGLLFPGARLLAGPAAADRLERAIYLEETAGDLEQAIEVYRQIAADEQAPAATREQAGRRLAAGLKKQGRPANAPQEVAAEEKQPQAPGEEAAPEKEPQVRDALQEAIGAIEQAYAFPIDRKQFVEKAVRALVAALDDESEYLTAEQLQELSHSFEQQLTGVGMQLRQEGGEILVVTPLPGSPSEKAGVLPGDRIVTVGDTKVADLPAENRLESVVKMLRGPAGESVQVEVRHAGKDDATKLTITRAQIQLESVRGDVRKDGEWDYLIDPENKIGYVRILQFGARTTAEVQAALKKLQAQGVKGLVLDLRGNPGGLMSEGVQVCDLFIENGTIVTVRSQGDMVKTFQAEKEGTIDDLPLAILVNRHTGSSAEILAACLQDHQRAAIVGERTFGRGIVQSILPLKSTGGALRLTTGVFQRPSGGTIHRGKLAGQIAGQENAFGVAPTAGFEVELSEEEIQKFMESRHARDLAPGGKPAAKAFEDRQLEKALAHLREKIKP